MILPTIRAIIYVTLGAVELVSDAYSAGKRVVRLLRPARRESHPLSKRDVDHIQAQIRSATTQGTHGPPPRKP